ncbi:hypothetical protein F4775DRAFT_579337 [Biscogniauxia sp. FL1348]|nr:hypothetical protein F4775DRAFT_579337 [Biscogniauxia sp. FL1348]
MASMAKNFPSDNVGTSPSDIYGHTSIARRFVTIASDQRALLDRKESWASFLRCSPLGFVNVPPEVLENLKALYIRQLQPTQSDDSLPSTETRHNEDDQVDVDGGLLSQDHQSSSSEEEEEEEGEEEEEEEEGEEEDDGEGEGEEPNAKAISNEGDDNMDSTTSAFYTPSPEHHFRARCEVEPAEIDEPFATQISETSPPKPTIQPPPKKPAFNDFPSSSLEQDDELEVEIPIALSNSTLTGSKPTERFATPPSAQVVPCTFEISESRPKPKTRNHPKQPIYNPPPPLYRPSKVAATPMNPVAGPSAAKAGTTNPPLANAQSSSSTSNTSSSIIPSTKQGEDIHKHPSTWMNQPVSSPPLAPQAVQKSVQPEVLSQVQPHDEESIPQSPPPESLPSLSPILHPAVSAGEPLANPEAPFARYTAAYPNYNGSISDFVTACMYIQLQQRRLRTSLYDDFIRAWFEGYLPYVRDCDDANPQVKAMNAIEWYNSIDDDPLFTSRVVTRLNLEATLNFYPNELQEAKNLLGVAPILSQESTQNLRLVPLNEKQVTVPEPAALPAETSTKDIAESVAELPSHEVAEYTMSRPRLPLRASPRKEPNRTMPPLKPTEEVMGRPVRSKGLSRSLSEVVPNKRKASDGLDRDIPKKVSTSFRMISDSGSSTSFHSEKSKGTAQQQQPSATPSSSLRRKKKPVDDPEKRSRQFAKFLKKRKWEKESIASSAPVSSMPPSGQKL